MAKRFFVQGTADIHLALQHIALDIGTSAERLAGAVLMDVVPRLMADRDAARKLKLPPPLPKPK